MTEFVLALPPLAQGASTWEDRLSLSMPPELPSYGIPVPPGGAAELGMTLEDMDIADTASSPSREIYIQELYWLRQRRGITPSEARKLINNPNIFAALMVHMGDADALVSGVTQHYPDTLRPALQIIKMREDVHRVSGLYVLITRQGEMLFLADCAVNIEPTAEELAEIALCAAETARRFDVIPRVAMLSFSNFGSVNHPSARKCGRPQPW